MGGTQKAMEAGTHRSLNAAFAEPRTVAAISTEAVCNGDLGACEYRGNSRRLGVQAAKALGLWK